MVVGEMGELFPAEIAQSKPREVAGNEVGAKTEEILNAQGREISEMSQPIGVRMVERKAIKGEEKEQSGGEEKESLCIGIERGFFGFGFFRHSDSSQVR